MLRIMSGHFRHHRVDGFRRQPLSPRAGREPVTDLDLAILFEMHADHALEISSRHIPHAEKALGGRRAGDQRCRIGKREGLGQKMNERGDGRVRYRLQSFGVFLLELADQAARSPNDFERIHHASGIR